MSQPPVGYNKYVAYSKSDTVNFDGSVSTYGGNVVPCDAIWVGTKGSTGTIVAIQQNKIACTFVGIAAGTILPIRAIRINSATTDASDFVLLYAV